MIDCGIYIDDALTRPYRPLDYPENGSALKHLFGTPGSRPGKMAHLRGVTGSRRIGAPLALALRQMRKTVDPDSQFDQMNGHPHNNT